ncbi:hypothetical protein J31TS4_06560 [Paenibacillus sp. J31TS4]|uniref:aminoglycoside phosphotransferase family protein n=1 Tax=Paenibacillus sp. J31TS4 TaxID=2807195 RepID=UPI001B2ED54F|nr:aminoglycoside phosphotransferase family protein [Paenibacillus sp. J31TS4]GIP37376.1 hypothetical protein J31TS4_06560 [Paenibacillus sp. J31TS4]
MEIVVQPIDNEHAAGNDAGIHFQWKELHPEIAPFLSSGEFHMEQMESGFEAEMRRVQAGGASYVLKHWNKTARPDPLRQYSLLAVLASAGLPVSRPVGWGTDEQGRGALLTSDDGYPVRQVESGQVRELAGMLAAVHRTQIELENERHFPRFGFVDYFFPSLAAHPDLQEAVETLVGAGPLRQDQLIHGDYHLRNLVEHDGRYTIIDWTNGQFGDGRYDLAWSVTIMRMYVSDRLAGVFRRAYLAQVPVEQEDLDRFEALAWCRWLLLDRLGGVPIGPGTRKRAIKLIQSNPHLAGQPFAAALRPAGGQAARS